MGYSKNSRIQNKEEITKIFKEGKKHSGKILKVYYYPSEEKKFSIRLESGIKGGVKRNKYRRRIKSIIEENLKELKNGLYIIMGKREGLSRNYGEIKEEFKELLEEGNLW